MSKVDCFGFGMFVGVILLVFVGVILLVVVTGIIDSHNPQIKPIEVYQGKTTLQITYEDSIPVDSIVVYKPEYRK